MGNDAEVYVFDDARYREEVVPGMLELLAGRPPAWLHTLGDLDPEVAALFEQDVGALLEYARHNPIDLARHCHYLQKDLGYDGEAEGSWRVGFEGRACRSATCPERMRCPFHWTQANSLGGPVEDVNGALERTVVQLCLGASQFVGRSVNAAAFYNDLLTGLGVAAADPTRLLLQRLGRRGFVVGYGFSSGDGIHGWLSAAETNELARRLGDLELPRYEPTFAAMEAFRRQKSGFYECAGFSFEALSLSFVRTVAVIAQAERRGVLWGNDLMTSSIPKAPA
jgi:hypothetical protein